MKKIRLTGGEPLLRGGVVDFVRELARLRDLARRACSTSLSPPTAICWPTWRSPLKDAGLQRVTVSMDAVDPDRLLASPACPTDSTTFWQEFAPRVRWALWPVKVNCVLMRGFNEDQIIPFGMFAREEGVVVRFIEFMPLEEDRTWSPETVVTLDEIVARMAEYRPLVEIPRAPKRDRPALSF